MAIVNAAPNELHMMLEKYELLMSQQAYIAQEIEFILVSLQNGIQHGVAPEAFDVILIERYKEITELLATIHAHYEQLFATIPPAEHLSF